MANCENCSAPISGPYCASCGQRVLSLRRPLWSLIREFAEEVFDLDGRVSRTVKPFFLQPGQLTTEYLAGRRASYTSPIRLFLFCSLVFFAVLSPGCPLRNEERRAPPDPASMLVDDHSVSVQDETGSMSFTLSSTTENEPARQLEGAFDDGQHITLQTDADVVRLWLHRQPTDEYYVMARQRQLDAEDRVNQFIARLISQDEDARREFATNLAEGLGTAVLLLPPYYALLLAVLFRRAKRTFVEHLIASLHLHAFAFVVYSAVTLLDVFSATASSVLAQVSTAGIIGYQALALRRIYGNPWWSIILRSTVLCFAYGIGTIVLLTAVAFLVASQ